MAVSKLIAASNANDFNLNITGFYTKITLDKEYAAGSYSLVSGNNDTSLDIYAFNAAGTSAGVTATKSFTATSGFNKLVIVGGQAGDVLGFTYKTTYPTIPGGAETGVPPIPTSISPTDMPAVNSTASLGGFNFAGGMAVTFTGTDAVARAAKTTTVGTSTSAVVTRPDVMPADKAPYSISISYAGVTPPAGSTAGVLTNAVTAGTGPVWTTVGTSLPVFTRNTSYTTTLVATDPDAAGSIASYTITSGALPTGLTLASNGVISGTPTSASAVTFTVRATNQDGDFVDRIFTMTNVGPAWSTASGNIDTGVSGDAYSFTLVATDDSGVTPIFTLTSGTLPTGLTLSSGGVISGTITGSTSTFSVTAVDANGTSAGARSFTITVAVPGVWSTVGTATTAYSATDAYGGVYNGFIYCGGGQNNTASPAHPVTWQKVALGTGVATLLANAPDQRDEMGSIWVGNKFYVVNGYKQNSSPTYSTPMIYDDSTNTWSIGASNPAGATGLSHNATDGTNLYSIFNNSDSIYRYNVSANTWTTLASRDNSNCAGGRRMAYRASNNTIYSVENQSSTGRQGVKRYNISTNTWTYSTVQINRIYDSPWTGSDNYQMGFDLDHTGDFIYMYGYDIGYAKTSPSRANGGTPDRILKYDITADTWTVTTFNDAGQCGNATGRVGRSYYSWGGAYYDTGGTLQFLKTLRTVIL